MINGCIVIFWILVIVFGMTESSFHVSDVIIVLLLFLGATILYKSFVYLLENFDKKYHTPKKKNEMEDIKEWSRHNKC